MCQSYAGWSFARAGAAARRRAQTAGSNPPVTANGTTIECIESRPVFQMQMLLDFLCSPWRSGRIWESRQEEVPRPAASLLCVSRMRVSGQVRRRSKRHEMRSVSQHAKEFNFATFVDPLYTEVL